MANPRGGAAGETPDLLFDGPHLRCWIWRRDATRAIATFDYFDPGRTGFPEPGTGGTVLADPEAFVLRIQSARNDWYLNDDLEPLSEALNAAAPVLGAVTMLGFSMGGYGAFLFAQTLGARRVVAVSPQAAVAPAKAPYDGRWLAERALADATRDDLGGRMPAGLGGFVLYDPLHAADRAHALRLAALAHGVRPVALAGGGHPATRLVAEAGAWRRFAAALRAQGPAGREIAALHRDLRRTSPHYWAGLAGRAAARGHVALAREALRRLRASGAPEALVRRTAADLAL